MVKCGLFRDQNLEDSLFENGYVKVPFLDEYELRYLRDAHSELIPKTEIPGTFYGIHMTTWAEDEKFKAKTKERLELIFDSPCERLFKDYRTLNHVFIIKEPGEHTEFNVHQDWSVIDEEKFYSVNIWAPVFNVDENNGALYILPGSHRIRHNIRGAGTLFPDYRGQFDEIRTAAKCIPVKAGEALVFFHSTIHGSPPNLSNERRVIAVNSVVPKAAPLRIHYQKETGGSVETYQPDDDFAYGYRNIREDSAVMPPNGKLVNQLDSYQTKVLSFKEMEALIIKNS